MALKNSLKRPVVWLLLAVGPDRAFGGNDGYEDEISSLYLWDSTVPNHSRLEVGDCILLWDKKSSLGLSVISDIDVSSGYKDLHHCPFCEKSDIKKRKTLSPLYRCGACKHEFDEPSTTYDVSVTEYRGSYSDRWLSIDGYLSGSELRSICQSPRSQHSLRPLVWDKLLNELAHHRVAFDANNQRWYKY